MDEQNQQPSLPQQPIPPSVNTPPTSPKSNMLLYIIGAIALLGLGLVGGFMLRGNLAQPPAEDNTQIAKASPATAIPTGTPSPTESPIPADWTVKTSATCNVDVPLPPKKEPYLIPEDPKTTSAANDEGRFWQYEETVNNEEKMFKNTIFATFRTENPLGNDYAPGVVVVECGQNTKNFSTDTLVEEYETKFKDGTISGISIAKKVPQTMWGKDVIALFIQGGMYDDNEPQYIFATDKHIYRMHKTAMSTNPFVKETTSTILQNLQFKD